MTSIPFSVESIFSELISVASFLTICTIPEKQIDRGAASWILFSFIMFLGYILGSTAFLAMFIIAFYIPLPFEIADRQKLQLLEFLFRVTNEYIGNTVETLFGPKIRNYFTRILLFIPFCFERGPPKWVIVQNEVINGVKVRVYYPKKRTSDAAIIFVHGGGWATMNARYYDGLMIRLIADLGTLIISIDYKLSPESPFPGPVNECDAVITSLLNEKYTEYKTDPNRVCIMGDSAGGNLCAVVAQRLNRRKNRLPKCQVLIYPVVHACDFHSPSFQIYYKQYRGTSLLNPRSMARWILLYLNIPATRENIRNVQNNRHVRREDYTSEKFRNLIGHDLLPESFKKSAMYKKPEVSETEEEIAECFDQFISNPDFCPLFGENLEGLSPAMIITTGYDILRDDGALYAKKLKSCGIPVQWNHYPTAYHAVLNMPYSSQRDQILADIIKFVRLNL